MNLLSKLASVAKRLLSDPAAFSQYVVGFKLYDYQIRPLLAVVDSVLHGRGFEFLIIFPRQSGKNELVAHLIVYLLNLFQRAGGNIVFGAIGDGLGRMTRRVENRLDNKWNKLKWKKGTDPMRRILGRAACVFLSTWPQAKARGETAHLLLVIDELQDQDATHLEQVFEPMRAARNATAVYIGTVKFSHDALWQKKLELERLEKEDGARRVHLVGPDLVIEANPAYGRFLDAKIKRFGRNHPVVKSEYFLEPIDGAGGLFPPQRLQLMRGQHERLQQPESDRTYIALIDVAGQDEATTDILAALDNPSRDYTIVTICDVSISETAVSQLHYKAVDVFVDHGSRHFESYPGKVMLAERVAAYLEHWGVVHTVCDETGVGEGFTSWLKARFPRRVTGYKFSKLSKASLGSGFVVVIETGRFKYWVGEKESDSWWFFQQAAACTYELPPNGIYERDLKWFVPAAHKTETTAGMVLTHDDRLFSAALVAVVDELYAAGKVLLGTAVSEVGEAYDPLDDLGDYD